MRAESSVISWFVSGTRPTVRLAPDNPDLDRREVLREETRLDTGRPVRRGLNFGLPEPVAGGLDSLDSLGSVDSVRRPVLSVRSPSGNGPGTSREGTEWADRGA
ncbi:hypothetical protein GCM10022252_71410 [Streptosporangium oxazolinicum]|uniref:Uncharacterized protein n=1 Tax=Streptosporangium oxazolinicum TaxID=909287 RepID=A0ABP8BJK5_9ACTN